MIAVLTTAGFPFVYSGTGNLEVMAVAFVNKPTDYAIKLFKLEGLVS